MLLLHTTGSWIICWCFVPYIVRPGFFPPNIIQVHVIKATQWIRDDLLAFRFWSHSTLDIVEVTHSKCEIRQGQWWALAGIFAVKLHSSKEVQEILRGRAVSAQCDYTWRSCTRTFSSSAVVRPHSAFRLSRLLWRRWHLFLSPCANEFQDRGSEEEVGGICLGPDEPLGLRRRSCPVSCHGRCLRSKHPSVCHSQGHRIY